MRPKQGMEYLQKQKQAQRKRQSYILAVRGTVGTPDYVIKTSRRKESLRSIPELIYIRSVSETLTLLSWRAWGHRGVRRRRWRPTARCKQEKKYNIRQRIGLIRNGYASFKISRSSFSPETLWGSWIRNTGPPNQKSRELIAIYQTMCHS